MPGLKVKYPVFEKPLIKLEDKIKNLIARNPDSPKVDKLIKEKKQLIDKIFSKLNSWQKVQLARHPLRPHTLDYINGIFDDFIEFHGDRTFGDDEALIAGMASLNGDTFVIIGHQKGENHTENIRRNFGMLHPEGYRKALRIMKIAEKFSMPVISFIDTPGAYPGIEAEERGQSEAIANNLKEMMDLKTPIIIIIIGEGGSGGALGIGVGDRILMLENAVYFVCTPEACSSILWRDTAYTEQAADNLKLTAPDLKKFNIIDEIVKEPAGGAHWNYEEQFGILKKRIIHHWGVLKRTNKKNIYENRYKKFRRMGVWK